MGHPDNEVMTDTRMRPGVRASNPWRGWCRTAVLAGIGAGAVTLSGCGPALDWREMKPPEAEGLQARFPCKPDPASRMVAVPGLSGERRVQMLVCQHEGTSWSLAYTRLGDMREVTPALDGLQQALRTNLQAAAALVAPDVRPTESPPTQVEVPRMTPQPAARALAFRTERPDGLGRPMKMRVNAWHFAHGLTVFQAVVWQPAERPALESGDDVADTFFQGFQFPE